ncbi:GerMN domain-containing protein [Clostridium nigeriense]|uniref:GerMN domain-containing protein n=1 Tax=Clostridium nigeriense TaxID=1805470 RepID=UPI00082AAE7A|nr:GerMN domain-containing protein [Clostridium nigeriense]
MKKKILAILLSLSIPFSLISCKDSSEKIKDDGNKVNTSTNVVDKETTSKDKNDNDNNNNKENESKESVKEANAKIYYYDVVTDKVVYINKVIKIEDNKTATALVNELKKSPNDDISPSISSEIILNSANVDKDTSTITVDFSSNFVSAQNLGAGAESSTLTAICNTFGSYFNVDNVIITLDGKPYSSGHILKAEGEAFKVDLKSSIELK